MSLRLDYTLEPLARVSAGSGGPVGNSRTVHRVLPGSVVRGALGTAWWKSPSARYRGPDGQSSFDSLFHDLMNVGVGVPSWESPTPVSIDLIPMSWATCKYPADDCPDGSQWWLERAVEDLGDCPGCGGPLEGGRGWDENRVPSEVSTRTALEGGVAKTGQLFSRRATARSVRYAGQLRLRTGADPNDPAVQWLLQPKEIFVGGQQSTMGRCRWAAALAASPPAAPPTQAASVLVLRSPAILVDAAGLPSVSLSAAITDAARRAGGSVKVTRCWTREGVRGGWNTVAGLPKPEERVVEAGSTALLAEMDTLARETLLEGIGLRRREGFGEVSIEALADDRRVVVRRPPAAQPAPPTVDPAAARTASLVDSLEPGARRGLLDAARHTQRLRETGMGPGVPGHIERVMLLPWCRDLGPDTQREISKALAADTRALIAALGARLRGGGQ
jgi:CRISPR-associated protein Csx10